MAYRRKTKRSYRRRTAKVSTQKVRRIVTNMAEKKYYDFANLDVTPVLSSYTFVSLLGAIQQGSTASTRIGNKIFVHSIEVNYCMTPLITMPAGGAICRIGMYHNKEAVGILPTSGQTFLENSVESTRYTPMINRITLPRDRKMTMVITGTNGAATVAVGPKMCGSFKIYPKKKIDFFANNGNVGDLYKDDYGVFYFCTDATSCNMAMTAKVIYSDA